MTNPVEPGGRGGIDNLRFLVAEIRGPILQKGAVSGKEMVW
jgi:hypothetical protein